MAVLGALLSAFAWIAFEVSRGGTSGFDRGVLLFFRHPDNPAVPFGPPWVPEMARDITALGSYVVLLIMLGAIVGYLLLVRKGASATFVLAAVLGGMLLSNVLKLGFDRARPDLVPHAARVFTASFPSGHALLSAVTYLTFGALLMRTTSAPGVRAFFLALAVFLTFVVGASRVYLGVHYPTDVLAGWCIGAAWAFACWLVAANLQREGKVEPPDQAMRTLARDAGSRHPPPGAAGSAR